MQHTQQRRRRTAGFTLVELMIVVAIIGVLAAIVVPKMMLSLDQANVNAAKAQIKNFQTALVGYKIKFKKYPTSLDALVNNGSVNYLEASEVPPDPWGNPYEYTMPGTHGGDYEIVSYGQDGQPGGDGFDADIQSWNLAATN